MLSLFAFTDRGLFSLTQLWTDRILAGKALHSVIVIVYSIKIRVGTSIFANFLKQF